MGRKGLSAVKFPEYCCGVCCYFHRYENADMCMVSEPVPVVQNDQIIFLRGANTDPEDPACRHFSPRHHG